MAAFLEVASPRNWGTFKLRASHHCFSCPALCVLTAIQAAYCKCVFMCDGSSLYSLCVLLIKCVRNISSKYMFKTLQLTAQQCFLTSSQLPGLPPQVKKPPPTARSPLAPRWSDLRGNGVARLLWSHPSPRAARGKKQTAASSPVPLRPLDGAASRCKAHLTAMKSPNVGGTALRQLPPPRRALTRKLR